MRIKGIGPPTSVRYAPYTQERIWLVVRNNHATEQIPEGGAAMFDTGGTTYTDAAGNSRLFGYDVDKPATANLPLWCGCASQPIDSVAQSANNFGEIQCYGYMDNTLVNRAGAADPDLGDAVWPINAQWHLDPGTPAPPVGADHDPCIVAELEATMLALGTGSLNIATWFRLMGPGSVA